MVEPRFIYAFRGVYGSAKDYFQVLKSLNLVGGKIFYGGAQDEVSMSPQGD
jgi:hypothetical protein